MVAISVMALCISATACAQSDKQSADSSGPDPNIKKDEIVFASTKNIRDINSRLHLGKVAIQNMIFESLVSNTADGIKLALAETWEISKAGKEYTFHLLEDISFYDCEKV